MKKKILALVLLSSVVSGLSAAAQDTLPPYNAQEEHSFATVVGAVAGAGATLYDDSNASIATVGKNALIGATIANGVIGADRTVGNPQWLPRFVKKPVLIGGGVIVLHLLTRNH